MTTEIFATVNSETIVDIACRHKLYGKGKIAKLRFSENSNKPEIFLYFESEAKSVAFAYTLVLSLGLLSFEDTDSETLKAIYEEYLANWTTFDEQRKAKKEAERQAELKAKEDAKRAKEEAKKAQAFELKKERDIKEFEAELAASRPLSKASEFYTALGWLTKHTGTVSAALPDYLDKYFLAHFGDVPHRVVDSKKKGPSGWTSQWTSSFQVSLKKPDCIPVIFEKYLNPARKALTKSEFVLELIDNYGFRFGKTQDLDEIRSCVPSEYITDFEYGLAM